jgi:thioredoxin/glutathione reductase (selenoprotein)
MLTSRSRVYNIRLCRLSGQFMSSFTHDFAVIGGGSGGLAAAKEAAKAGANVVLFDFVTPSHRGTTWGFAGTCVNVGCIPKKLFHYSALLGESIHDMRHAGWSGVITAEDTHGKHNWNELVTTVTNYIRKLNFSYRTGARSAGVQYINAKARFVDGEENVLEYQEKGETKTVRAKHVLVAVGGRPTIPPNIKGVELAITSDDVFRTSTPPNRTLVVGGGYIALECASFLTAMGYPTTVCVRSVVLRSFDQQMASKIQAIMHEQGTNFEFGKNPVELLKKDNGVIRVLYDDGSSGEFDTVLLATGRTPATKNLNLPGNASIHPSGKLVADSKTCLVNGTKAIYAVGDCLLGSLELTPVAIKDGEFLARRLFKNDSSAVFDKRFIPTTVFTASEYGCVGLSEEAAIQHYGAANVDSYLYEWPSLERAALHREKPLTRRADEADVEVGNNCFTKLVVKKSDGVEKVVGFHFIGPNAGEVTQGFALAVKLGATKADFDDLVGIHPTDAEALCGLNVTKSSGGNFVAAGGCGGGKCG